MAAVAPRSTRNSLCEETIKRPETLADREASVKEMWIEVD
jgi:hypothetical protein